MDTQVTVILMALCLALSAFFSSSETAFFTLQGVRVHHMVASGVPNADRVERMKRQPERFLSTVLLGNNLVNTALAALATTLAFNLLGAERHGLGTIIATVAATIGIVVLGEAAPKIFAARHAERLALLLVRPWEVMERVLFPLAFMLHGVSRFLTGSFGQSKSARPMISEEEIETLVRLGAREGSVEQTQAQIIHRAFRFGDLRAQEIMTPRTEIEWVRSDATLRDFLHTYREHAHTRFPALDEGDNVVGLVHLRDVVKALADGTLKEADPIRPWMRTAHFYPETKSVDDLFVEMRSNGTQMVMLVNEYGGIAGLLTLRQIVSEVVGRITEEEEEPEVQTIDERTSEVDAAMRVEDANERLALGLPDGDYDTLAGFVLASLGHVPKEGEQVQHGALRLVVTHMKGLKIERILVTRS